MGRWASATNETAAAQPSVTLVVLVDLDFVGGVVRAHDGIGELTHNGQAYYGVGKFGSIELAPESFEVEARGAILTLSGIPGDFSPDILAEDGYQNRAATLTLGLLNQATGAWADTPEVLWEGLIDYMEVSGSAGELSVRVYVEDELRREPRQSWNTDEDQRLRYAGDSFFADLPNIESFNATWGQKQVKGGGFRVWSSIARSRKQTF